MDETQQLVDSVMGNLKALLQEMSDESQTLRKQWEERSKALTQKHSWQMYEPTEREERAEQDERRACDELYDKAQTINLCMIRVAATVKKIIGENIVIQFSKWNM